MSENCPICDNPLPDGAAACPNCGFKLLGSTQSFKPLDLRGLLAAMKIVRTGLSPWQAVRMGIVNKTFDVFEKEIVEDVVRTRIPQSWTREDVYGE